MNYHETLESLKRERTAKALEVTRIDNAITALQALAGSNSVQPKPRLSATALNNIRAAQKQRWAKFRAAKKKQKS